MEKELGIRVLGLKDGSDYVILIPSYGENIFFRNNGVELVRFNGGDVTYDADEVTYKDIKII